jgi:xanthine dehydrogenase molybdopterin-binding subunit B
MGAGTLHAAILRSWHAHAEIQAIDTTRALAMPGVACVVTGEDNLRWTRPFIAAVKSPIERRCLATNRARYQGEPVAVVAAGDRYRAEDVLETIHVAYRPLAPVLDPRGAASDRDYRGLSAQRLRADRVLRPRRRAGVTQRLSAADSRSGSDGRQLAYNVRRWERQRRRSRPVCFISVLCVTKKP